MSRGKGRQSFRFFGFHRSILGSHQGPKQKGRFFISKYTIMWSSLVYSLACLLRSNCFTYTGDVIMFLIVSSTFCISSFHLKITSFCKSSDVPGIASYIRNKPLYLVTPFQYTSNFSEIWAPSCQLWL